LRASDGRSEILYLVGPGVSLDEGLIDQSGTLPRRRYGSPEGMKSVRRVALALVALTIACPSPADSRTRVFNVTFDDDGPRLQARCASSMRSCRRTGLRADEHGGPQVLDAGAHPTITFHSATIDTPTRTVGRSPALTRFAGANELLGRAHFSLVVSMNPAYLQRSRSPVEQRSASRPCVRRSEPERSRSNSFERIIAKRFATTG